MPEIQELVAVGEVKKPRADSVKADFGAARQEISTDAKAQVRWLFPCWLRSA
jgi:hypothetical protein